MSEPSIRGWRAARAELIIAAITVISVATAAAAMAGWGGALIVVGVTVAAALIVLRVVIPYSAAEKQRLSHTKARERVVSGYAQRLHVVSGSRTSRAAYEGDLRPVLEHILAARLAERHAVNLYTEPEAARRAFCRASGDARLWPWIDPAQALEVNSSTRSQRGIPGSTLNQLIIRLEQL